MISDFLSLEPEETGKNGEKYICCLPDPEPSGDYKMIACGRIKILKNHPSGKCVIRIELDDNFESLCVGDIYRRKEFLVSVLYLLRRNTDLILEHARIILKDFTGIYIGTADGLSSA